MHILGKGVMPRHSATMTSCLLAPYQRKAESTPRKHSTTLGASSPTAAESAKVLVVADPQNLLYIKLFDLDTLD